MALLCPEVPVFDYEFSSLLADGRQIHVLAHVGGGYAEIESVTVGPIGDDVPLPLSKLTPAQVIDLEDEAVERAYEDQRMGVA
jgi:hypothetical protein